MARSGHIQTITIHHSASSREETKLENIDKWHRDRKFDEIGYHFVVEGDGEIRSGRGPHLRGAHVGGHNTGNIGVCVVGNNCHAGDEWTTAQCLALRELVHALLRVYNLELTDVLGHRDWEKASTQCPGIDITAILGP